MRLENKKEIKHELMGFVKSQGSIEHSLSQSVSFYNYPLRYLHDCFYEDHKQVVSEREGMIVLIEKM